jgi:hypothetical protein
MEKRELVESTKKRLVSDLELFLKDTKNFELAKTIERYCADALKGLEGHFEQSEKFSKFIDILYGCQQLDNFGEAWAPTEKKVRDWILFLKKFSV